jgi:hypothetical protein
VKVRKRVKDRENERGEDERVKYIYREKRFILLYIILRNKIEYDAALSFRYKKLHRCIAQFAHFLSKEI